MEAPFSDKEKRIVLSEAIKTSSVPIEKLLAFIVESDVQPEWKEMLMPHGRNLNSCINFWDSIYTAPHPASSSLTSVPGPVRKRKSDGLEPLQSAPPSKRRQSGTETMIRIQPKPSKGSPQAFSSTPPTAQAKKRGRPSKADIEARNAAGIARGEIIAPQRTLAARETMGGEPGAESGSMSGVYASLPAMMPTVAPRPDPRMKMSFQSGVLEAESSDMAEAKARGARPSSRSSKDPSYSKGSFSNYGPPRSPYEILRPPATIPPISEPPRPSLLPPKPEEGGFGAPVYPAIDALLSPEPPRPERQPSRSAP